MCIHPKFLRKRQKFRDSAAGHGFRVSGRQENSPFWVSVSSGRGVERRRLDVLSIRCLDVTVLTPDVRQRFLRPGLIMDNGLALFSVLPNRLVATDLHGPFVRYKVMGAVVHGLPTPLSSPLFSSFCGLALGLTL